MCSGSVAITQSTTVFSPHFWLIWCKAYLPTWRLPRCQMRQALSRVFTQSLLAWFNVFWPCSYYAENWSKQWRCNVTRLSSTTLLVMVIWDGGMDASGWDFGCVWAGPATHTEKVASFRDSWQVPKYAWFPPITKPISPHLFILVFNNLFLNSLCLL